MPSLYLPYVNIALDAFGLLVMVIVLLSCVNERVRDSHGTSRPFMLLLVFFCNITNTHPLFHQFSDRAYIKSCYLTHSFHLHPSHAPR